MTQDEVIILVSVPSMGNPSFRFLQSLLQLAQTCKYHLIFNFVEGTVLSKARNGAAQEAINRNATHLLFIDDDMVFLPGVVEKMVEQDKDIIGALCFGRTEKIKPIAKRLVSNELIDYSWEEVKKWTETKEIDATGTGFLLVKTEVFKRMQPPFFAFRPATEFGLKPLPFPDDEISEDTYFMMKAKMAGYQVFIDPTIIIGHHGTKVYQRPLPEEPVAIFIPSMSRFDRLIPLAETIKKTTKHPYTIYLITDEPEAEEAAKKMPNTVFIKSPKDCVSYAKRINYLYQNTSERYFFTGSNDITFCEGWLENALLNTISGGVVAVNDGFNPNGTNFLIDREYIKTFGGTFFNENEVMWEGYRHNFCDTELISKARVCNQYVYVQNSYVLHEHYLNKKRLSDMVDEIATSSYNDDRLKFTERWEKYKKEQYEK